MSTNVVGVNLPEEIITDILSRLPVTSLCRLKCVSHLWLTLISDPQFAKIHLIRSRPRERIILVNRNPCPGSLYSVDYGNDVTISTKLDFPEFSVEHAFVFGSCNGLLFIVDFQKYSMFLVNPTTRNVKKLPDLLFFFLDSSVYNQFGFGYDSFNDDYKLVLLNYCTDISKDAVVSVYSLNTNLWRRLQNYPKWVSTTMGVSVNGRVHWLATGTDFSNNYSPAIIVFDLADENFREMPLPISTKNDDDSVLNENRLAVVGGCLCYFVNKSKIQKDFWIMHEYGVTESWTKIRFNILDNYMYHSCLPGEDKVLFSLVLFTIDGEKMVLYNPKEETIREVVLSGFSASFVFFGKYVETLVSPN